MIALDTNVLVRFVMQDDLRQAALANELMESLSVDEPGLIPLVVMVELVWVLTRSYKLKREQVTRVIEGLLTSRELVVAQSASVWGALRGYRTSKSDFSDCLITRCAFADGCSSIMTFDHAAAKHAGMQLIQ